MLKRLHLKNFTVFADADFEFGPGLNVLVGTNGTGKSHVLKVGYAVELSRAYIEDSDVTLKLTRPKNERWIGTLNHNLAGIFLNGYKRIVSFNSLNKTLVIKAEFEVDDNVKEVISFQVSPPHEFSDINADIDKEWEDEKVSTASPVFIPAKEILTLAWLLPASQQVVIGLDISYFHLLEKLRLLPLRNPEATSAINALASIIGGEIQADGDSYYFVDTLGHRISANMMAEGLRKFGTLQKLLANGSLIKKSTLYWDEPESNLNPALLRKLAAILAELARQGFQIILATHSTDLLKEFHILSRQKDALPLPIKYFGLNAEPGEATRIVSTDNFEFLPDVVALAEELKQADELEEIFIREDREHYANNRGEEPGV